MYDRILVAIDFSDPATDALRWTVRHFPEAEIHLFHAIEQWEPPGYLLQAVGDELDLKLEERLDVHANLEVLAQEVGIEPRILVRTGWPPRQLGRAAEEVGAELVVVGAHTRRIWPWDEPGTMATKIVEQSAVPVLVWRPVPRRGDPEDRTVMATLDLREGGKPIAVEAARAAAWFGARLVLLHVLPRTLQAYLRAVSSAVKAEDTMQRVDLSARRAARSQVPAEFAAELAEVRPLVMRGRPITQILAVAEAESVNLIVMGQSHVIGFAERALLGDVTGKVLRGANCSVLVVPLRRRRDDEG